MVMTVPPPLFCKYRHRSVPDYVQHPGRRVDAITGTRGGRLGRGVAGNDEMTSIRSDYLGYPAHTELAGSTYCCAEDAEICELVSGNMNVAQAKQWQVTVARNKKGGPCDGA